MKIYTKSYEVFEFEELSEEGKNKAINDHIKFILECVPFNELSKNIKKAIAAADKMKTPWFTASYIYEYALEEIEENLKNESFLVNGKIFN